MNASYYPDEHIFLLNCLDSSDFNSQVKICFQRCDQKLAESISEELEKLSNSLSQLENVNSFINSIDPNTLNYVFDNVFLERYRSISDFIKNNIDDVKFERLCAYYIGLLGCRRIEVTRRTHDQGLDFYGIHQFDDKSFFSSVSEKVFLIGQAKLYTSKVGTKEIREFVGSIELIKREIYSRETYSYKFATELKHYTLINPIFISSSSFSKDAEELCRKLGVRMIDIVKLSALLASVTSLFDSNNNLDKQIFSQEISSIAEAQKS